MGERRAFLQPDPRYRVEAYQFVRDALAFATELFEKKTAPKHLSGQELCEGIRQYAVDQFGYLAKPVLNSWGVTTTGDFGEIVYDMIEQKFMDKSESDRREDFDDQYDFDEAFLRKFAITLPD